MFVSFKQKKNKFKTNSPCMLEKLKFFFLEKKEKFNSILNQNKTFWLRVGMGICFVFKLVYNFSYFFDTRT